MAMRIFIISTVFD